MEQKISPAIIILIGLGLGLVAAVGVYAVARAAQPPTEAKVKVRIKNAGPNIYWLLTLLDTQWGESIKVENIPIEEAATFDIPEDWTFPLFVDLLLYISPEDHTILYHVQSAYGPDSPDYKDISIPNYGDYYYNVSTERFEKVL